MPTQSKDVVPKSRSAKTRAVSGATTMQKVADMAGVSAMTVSRALRGDALVTKVTRDRILAAVARTGYVPDATARTFATRRTGFVAVLVPSLNNSNFADTVRGSSEVLDSAGLQMLLGDTEYKLSREESLIATLLQRRPEAVIITGGDHTVRSRKMLTEAHIPVVETWDIPKEPLGHVVGFSNREAGAEMVRYLYERGRRRIGFIGGAINADTRGSERRAGYEQAVRELRLPGGRIVALGKPSASMSQGAKALERMLRRWPDTDAIVCVSDLSAFGVLAEGQRRGIAIPSQLALAGFGDFEIARCCSPRLTTVAVDCVEIGRRAGKVVLDALASRERGEPAAVTETTIVDFQIIERETA
jgi:LacI family gluconate utilization system Gnt-I transcriptional repressor